MNVPPSVSDPDPSTMSTSWRGSAPFVLVHFVPLLAFFVDVTLGDWLMMVTLFVVRMFFITAGYHRYFAHRSYTTSRVFQFVLAFGGATAAQKGPLWWAGHHRLHHQHSDTELDAHTPFRGVIWSHVGWILSPQYKDTPTERIKDFARYPELVWLNRHDAVAPWSLAIVCFLIGGWSALFIGFTLSTVLLWHGTFMVNSVAHLIGTRRYATNDTSRNNAFVALVTLGEGWHNNHHYYPVSARQGFFWWELDISYLVLRVLSWMRIVSNLKRPSVEARSAMRIKDGNLDRGMMRSALRDIDGLVEASKRASDDPEREDVRRGLDDAIGQVYSTSLEVATLDRALGRARRRAIAAGSVTVGDDLSER
jgi:stearoyl-CoA desaturase (delta-9 desaturase)